MKVLLILLDFFKWEQARAWTYSAQFSFREGFIANNVDYKLLVAYGNHEGRSWIDHIREVCKNQKFDQVWMEIVHSKCDEDLLEYLKDLAPVRIGFLGESLTYTAEEVKAIPQLSERREKILRKLHYMTHALAGDELDIDFIQQECRIPAKWWLASIPSRIIKEKIHTPEFSGAMFSGSIYGERKEWLENPILKNNLILVRSPENGTIYPNVFNALNRLSSKILKMPFLRKEVCNNLYVSILYSIRKRCFHLWLDGLKSAGIVVQLPHYYKAFPGRIFEGMAIGRPVVTMRIKNRPKVMSLFEENKEIVFYSGDDASDLGEKIIRLQNDNTLRDKMVKNARKKMMEDFTVEQRVLEILEWIKSG